MTIKEMQVVFSGRFYDILCDGEIHVERKGFRHFTYEPRGKCVCEKEVKENG